MKLENLIPIQLEDFEDEELLKAKTSRSFGEYCWTCTPSLIFYIIQKYSEPICTYIDADMYFYEDPQVLIDEMISENKTVMIVPHRFSPENKRNEKNGIFCVEFNTFLNKRDSLEVLQTWKDNCIRFCTSINDGKNFGDQKYLDEWPIKYPSTVHVCNHAGAGLAPWNIEWYQHYDKNSNSVFFKKEGVNTHIVFYHFQHIIYMSRNLVKTHIAKDRSSVDYKLVDQLYIDYLQKLENAKQFLELEYNINYLIKEHPAKRDVVSWKTILKKNGLIRWLDKRIHSYNYLEEYELTF
jgi:hypothetical protein